MELIKDIESIKQPFYNSVITIGNFDGVHIGHQALFHTVIEKADAIKGKSLAMTFEPHPIRVLTKHVGPPLITIYKQKVSLISNSGIDALIVIPFTRKFAEISPHSFIKDILIDQIGMKVIVSGKDYTFGKNRGGNLKLLKSMSDNMGFEVITVDWIKGGISDRISSTRIRELVTEGKMDRARQLLGRYYRIMGKVRKGKGRGGKIVGFPTVNIKLYDELCPKVGVYAVKIQYSGREYKGVANIGYNPTFKDQELSVEVHILDFNKSIYDQNISVDFIKRLRNEKKFPGASDLSAQIKRDIAHARKIL